MKKTKSIKNASTEEWLIQAFRLTAFLEAPIEGDLPCWWKELVEEEPETRTLKPRENGLEEEGEFGTGRLALALNGSRVDWLFNPDLKPEKEIEGYPALGRFEDEAGKFIDLIKKWLGACPEINRLALGSVLLLPKKNSEKCYETLSKYLADVKLDAKGSTDFSYTINRARKSNCGVSDLIINRLSKWSVLRLNKFRLNLATRQKEFDEDISACRLEMDINTSADFKGPITREKLIPLLDELVGLSREIILKGDIK